MPIAESVCAWTIRGDAGLFAALSCRGVQVHESWLRGLEDTFRTFGGITEEVFPDNVRALVIRHDASTREVEFNDRFLNAVGPTRARSATLRPCADQPPFASCRI